MMFRARQNGVGLELEKRQSGVLPTNTGAAESEPKDQSAALRAIPFRGGGFEGSSRKWMPWFAFCVLLIAWQTASSLGLINSLFLPSPLDIIDSLKRLITSGKLVSDLSASLYRLLLGWFFGALVGVVVGACIGFFSPLRAIGLPFVSAFFPIPKIALLPLFILWLGIGDVSKIATVALGVFFPMVISSYSGVDNVPRNLIRMGQSLNMPFLSVVLKIVVPGMLPSILAGCRIASSIALILLVSAEMIGADRGIGSFLLTAGNLMQTADLMAGVVVIAILGLLLGTAITMLERVLLSWR